MKRMDIFCASQASTAICMSMDVPSCSSSSISQLGGRAIDRYNPIIRDQRRTPRGLPTVPCTSQPLPIEPTPYHLLPKGKKGSSSSKSKAATEKSKRSSKRPKDQKPENSSAKAGDDVQKINSIEETDVVKKSLPNASDFITPPDSSRYLLSDKAFLDGLSDYDSVLSLVPPEESNKLEALNQDDEPDALKPSTSARLDKPSNQVVVLRVSLHCRGCERKMRKHLSRMEGVTSYNIDFAAKKVTVEGNVTPLSVLSSVSKVKSAQLWTSATATPAVGSNNTQVMKN